MTDIDIDERVRNRFAALADSRFDDAAVLESVGRHRVRLRRQRAAARASVVLLALGVVAGALAVATRDNTDQLVVSQPSTVTQRQPVELLTIAWDAGPQIADPATGNRSSIGPRGLRGGPIVRVGDQLFTAYDGRLYSFAAGDGELRGIGPGDGQVFPSATRDSLFVSKDGRIEERNLDGTFRGGPWTIPSGYELTEPPRAWSRGFVVTRKTEFIGDLALWDKSSGSMHLLGKYNQFIDSYADAQGNDTLAWTCGAETDFPCELIFSNRDASRKRNVAPPVRGNGFYGGGAFSPDGKTLATTVSTKTGVNQPTAGLALVDIAKAKATFVKGSTFSVGESYGYVSWSPDGSTVFFGGLDDDGVESYDLRTHKVTKYPFGGNYYSVGVLPSIDRRNQCPGTKHAWQRRPVLPTESGDGLPKSGEATARNAGAVVGPAGAFYGAIGGYPHAEPGYARNGATGTVVAETIYTEVLLLPSKRACPKLSAYWDGIPLTFVIAKR